MLRTVEISSDSLHLSMKREQLIIKRDGEQISSIPLADIGLLIIDNGNTVYTHQTLTTLLNSGGAVLFCGKNHLPVGLALPTNGHHLQSERLRSQLSVTKPTVKRLWKQLIQAKLVAQADACRDETIDKRLRYLAAKVKPGDPENIEAQGAVAYWKVFLSDETFRRRQEGDSPNDLLNYGYMVIRASIARAVAVTGFHCALGINHSNRYNGFCLADDLLEPFRPLVDQGVRWLYEQGSRSIGKEDKQALLTLLQHPMKTTEGTTALVSALPGYIHSLHRCYLGKQPWMDIPEYSFEPDVVAGKAGRRRT